MRGLRSGAEPLVTHLAQWQPTFQRAAPHPAKRGKPAGGGLTRQPTDLAAIAPERRFGAPQRRKVGDTAGLEVVAARRAPLALPRAWAVRPSWPHAGSASERPSTVNQLPPGWRWAKLDDACDQDREIVEPNSRLAAQLPYLSLEHVESNTGRILKKLADGAQGEAKSTTFAFDSRHVLYGKLRPYLNKVALPECSGRCTTEIIPLLPRDGVDREFLCWLLRRPETVELAMRERTGSRMPRADMGELMKLGIPLPPLAEQKRIARILTEQTAAVERARASAEAQLQAAESLPAAYLRAVFNGPGSHGWPGKRLREVCDIQLGKMLSPKSKAGVRPRPYLRNANVQWNRFDLSTVLAMDFADDEEEKFALKRGDLLVCEGGEPGRSAVWDGAIEPCCYQKALHRLRPIERRVDPRFVMYRLWLGANQSEFSGSHAKTTIAHLPAVRLAEIEMGIPPLADQRRIAAQLSEQMASAERLVRTLADQLDTVNRLPAALLRQAFSGKL